MHQCKNSVHMHISKLNIIVLLIELVSTRVDVLNADSGLLQRSAPTTLASLPYMP